MYGNVRKTEEDGRAIRAWPAPGSRPQKKTAVPLLGPQSRMYYLYKKKAASYSPALHCSTIGADGLNFSVRNGKRWDPDAITT